MKNKEFVERQSFITWWLAVLFVILLFVQLKPIYEHDWNIDTSTYISLAIFILVLISFILIRLNTRINEQGVNIRFLPFVRSKTWHWTDIADVYIKEYSLVDYGGWGYRVGKNGVAYNTKGKYGLQLVLKNGARIMIGTQRPDEIQDIVNTFRKINNENNY